MSSGGWISATATGASGLPASYPESAQGSSLLDDSDPWERQPGWRKGRSRWRKRAPCRYGQVSRHTRPCLIASPGRAAQLVSRAPFFTACVLLVVVWLPTIVLVDFNTSQLLINTPTTIVTVLLVALLQNTETRNQQAIQRKLNAIADGLADLMEELAEERPDLNEDRKELRQAVGLE